MLEYLFGNKSVEQILIYVWLHDKAYASELSKLLESPLTPIQKALLKLEDGGLLVSFKEGKTRLYQWNPRYPFLEEIKSLVGKSYEYLPPKAKKHYQPLKRKRPRKPGKPLD